MTPEQIEARNAAVRAAVEARCKGYSDRYQIDAAIAAYEAEKPKPVKIDRLMDAQWHSVDVNSARVRLFGDKGILDTPLPKPPEEKT